MTVRIRGGLSMHSKAHDLHIGGIIWSTLSDVNFRPARPRFPAHASRRCFGPDDRPSMRTSPRLHPGGVPVCRIRAGNGPARGGIKWKQHGLRVNAKQPQHSAGIHGASSDRSSLAGKKRAVGKVCQANPDCHAGRVIDAWPPPDSGGFIVEPSNEDAFQETEWA